MSSVARRAPRPTTPLRRVERGSISALSNSRGHAGSHDDDAHGGEALPLESLDAAFADLADAFADLSANMAHICELGQEVGAFNESFSSFLYGLNVNAFCVDFPEAPVAESYRRAAERRAFTQQGAWTELQTSLADGLREARSSSVNQASDATFMTTDDSFVERPPPPTVTVQPQQRTTQAGTGRNMGASNGKRSVSGLGGHKPSSSTTNGTRTTTDSSVRDTRDKRVGSVTAGVTRSSVRGR
ncbi:DASH complex subunit dam1 [Savitreella phatthalungensis]